MTENNGLVFHADNLHGDESGRPPAVTGTPEKLHLYFQNRYGEQWVATIDPETGRGEVRSGDVGWDKELELVDGGVLGGVLLSLHETRIIQSFWEAATGKPATSPALMMATLAECLFYEPRKYPSTPLKEVIENAKSAGKKSIAITKPSDLGRDYGECLANLRMIEKAELTLRVLDLETPIAAMKAKFADWNGDGSGRNGSDDDRPPFSLPIPMPGKN